MTGIKKELTDAAVKAVGEASTAMVDTMSKAVTEAVGKNKNDPMSRLQQLADDFTAVDVKIFRWDEKNHKTSLFTTVPGMLLADMASLDPHTICKREGGGGNWKVVYAAPDGKGRSVEVANISTEGAHQVMATHEADKLGLDPRTGLSKGVGGLPVATMTPFAQADIMNAAKEAAKDARGAERDSFAQVFAANAQANQAMMNSMMSMVQQARAQDQGPRHDEGLQALRDEIKALHAAIAQKEADTRMMLLQQEIKALHDKIAEGQKTNELRLLEAKVTEATKAPARDPILDIMATVMGATREDAKAQTQLLLEMFNRISDRPDSTDQFAKIQGLLMQSAIQNLELVSKVASSQGGPQSPAVEIARTIAEVAANYFGSRGGEEEETDEEVEPAGQLSGVPAKQLPPKPVVVPEEPETTDEEPEEAGEASNEEDGAVDITKVTKEELEADFRPRVAAWLEHGIPAELEQEGILLGDKDLARALATSSFDSAIRLLVSKRAPVAEITARLHAMADANHPLAIHWLQQPLPTTFQILTAWDKQPGCTGASARIADLVIDIMLHWKWIAEGNDPYGRSNYRPPKAAPAAQARVHGVSMQGKQVSSPLGRRTPSTAPEESDEGDEEDESAEQ